MTLQALLGIDYPLIQAPMAGVQGSALAVAVSNAGGSPPFVRKPPVPSTSPSSVTPSPSRTPNAS